MSMATLLPTFTLALLVVNQATAFVPVQVSFKEVPTFSTKATLGRRQTSLSSRRSSSSDGPPSWRYEVDDLIKAASPWGSCVETEIIATDLGKILLYVVGTYMGEERDARLKFEPRRADLQRYLLS